MVDEPMVEHAGGAVAAPIFRRVAQAALKYRGLTPQSTDRVDVSTLSRKPDRANAAYALLREQQGVKPAVQESADVKAKLGAGQVRVPDMTGWPLREALKQLAELGVKPRVSGSGLLARQEPGPGGVVEKGATVLLVFEPAS